MVATHTPRLPITATWLFKLLKPTLGQGNSIQCFLRSQDRIRTCILYNSKYRTELNRFKIYQVFLLVRLPFRHLTIWTFKTHLRWNTRVGKLHSMFFAWSGRDSNPCRFRLPARRTLNLLQVTLFRVMVEIPIFNVVFCLWPLSHLTIVVEICKPTHDHPYVSFLLSSALHRCKYNLTCAAVHEFSEILTTVTVNYRNQVTAVLKERLELSRFRTRS